jgi:hypothetical protein
MNTINKEIRKTAKVTSVNCQVKYFVQKLMLFRSSPLCSDQRGDFIDFGPKLIFDFAMFPVPISLMKSLYEPLTRAVHIAS